MKIIVLAILLTALIIAAGAMGMAWELNPQCEYHCEGVVYWPNLFLVGGIWFLIVSVTMLFILLPLYWLLNRKKVHKRIQK